MSREKRVCNIDLVEEREEISYVIRGVDVIGERGGVGDFHTAPELWT